MTQRRIQSKRSLLCSRNLQKSFVQLAVEVIELVGFVAREKRIYADDVAILRLKAEVLLLKIVQAAQQQAGGTQEDHGERGLGDDQHPLRHGA